MPVTASKLHAVIGSVIRSMNGPFAADGPEYWFDADLSGCE